MDLKVLVTGVKGQLGFDVVKRLEIAKVECLGVDIDDFDLTGWNQTKDFICNYKPEVVVHCAAYTAVDRAEDEREICHAVNVKGTRHVAMVCREIGAKMVYISTDYVFNGTGQEPFEIDQIPEPINYYGQTKFEGELETRKFVEQHFIIRVSWVFGVNGNNFIKTMLRLGKERDAISVVSDQIGSPTYTFDLAELISQVIVTDKYGIYHATNEGLCSWYEFARQIFHLTGMSVQVNPINSEDYITKAKRPKNSRLSKLSLDNAGFIRLPEWEDALRRYLSEVKAIQQ